MTLPESRDTKTAQIAYPAALLVIAVVLGAPEIFVPPSLDQGILAYIGLAIAGVAALAWAAQPNATHAQIRSAISSGTILHAAGPWRTTGRWWSEDGRFAVDHYDVQVSDGSLLRLRFDWIRRRWEVDAIYD